MQGSNNRFWGLEPSNTSNNMFIIHIYIHIYISYTTTYYTCIWCICIIFRHIRNIQTCVYQHTYRHIQIHICMYIYMYLHIHAHAHTHCGISFVFLAYIDSSLYQVSKLPNLIIRGTKNRSHWRRWPQTSCCTLMWGAGVKFLWWVRFFELRIRKVEVSKWPNRRGEELLL